MRVGLEPVQSWCSFSACRRHDGAWDPTAFGNPGLEGCNSWLHCDLDDWECWRHQLVAPFNDDSGFSEEPTHADGESSDACRDLDINAGPSWSWETLQRMTQLRSGMTCWHAWPAISMQLSELRPYAHLWL